MSLKEFTYLSDLGEGSFGRVIKARRHSDTQVYAIKQVRISPGNVKDLQNTLNEIRILASIDHDNIISYKEAFYETDNESLCIVMEFADGGDLQGKIESHQKKGTRFEEKEIWKVAEQLLKGLKALEQYKIIHRDIKCANIFFSKGVAKLGDMNVSKVTEASFASTQTGTPYYASPEVWRSEVYSYKSDIWSLGCVLYEMCSFEPPFKAKNLQSLNKKIQAGHFSRIPSIYSSRLSSFINYCLTVDDSKRADVNKLLKIMNYDASKDLHKVGYLKKNIIDEIQAPEEIEDLNKILPKPHYDEANIEPAYNVLDYFLKVQPSPLHNRLQSAKHVKSQNDMIIPKSPRIKLSQCRNEPVSLKHIPDIDNSYIGDLIRKKEDDIRTLKKKPVLQKVEKPVQPIERGVIKRQKLSLVNLHYGYIPKALRPIA